MPSAVAVSLGSRSLTSWAILVCRHADRVVPAGAQAGEVGAVGGGVAGPGSAGDDHVRVQGGEQVAVGQAGLGGGPGCGVGRGGERPPGQRQGALLAVGAGDGQGADLRAGGGVQQGEQAGQALVRVGGGAGPPAQQRALGGGVQHGSGEGELGSWPQRPGRVDEDELALPGPGEVAVQHVDVLMAAARPGGEEAVQVGGGDLGPAGDAPGGQVAGEVAEDAQAAFEGDVAELAAPGAAGAVLLGELAVVERGDRAARPAGTASR